MSRSSFQYVLESLYPREAYSAGRGSTLLSPVDSCLPFHGAARNARIQPCFTGTEQLHDMTRHMKVNGRELLPRPPLELLHAQTEGQCGQDSRTDPDPPACTGCAEEPVQHLSGFA